MIEHALALERAGCFSIVLECVPRAVAAAVTAALKIPTIGRSWHITPATSSTALCFINCVVFHELCFRPSFLLLTDIP